MTLARPRIQQRCIFCELQVKYRTYLCDLLIILDITLTFYLCKDIAVKYALIIPNLSSGGAEKAMIRLAIALKVRGHEVHLILIRSGKGHEVSRDIQVHRLFRPGRREFGGSLGKLLAVRRLRKLHRVLAGVSPFDAIISTLPYADHTVHLAKLPCVWYRIANTLSEEVAELTRVSRMKGKKRLTRIRKVYGGKNLIVNSEGSGKDLVDNIGVRDAHIEIIFNYVDVETIRALSQKQDPHIPTEPFVIYVGRNSSAKRLDVLLRAWRIADLPYKMVLLTKPSLALEKLIEKEGVKDRVVIAGFQTNPYPWIRAAEMLVLSSDREGLPNVLLESLWLNTKVVSTDCPSGPREILEFDPEKFLVPVNDAEALGAKIRNLWGQAFETPDEFCNKFSPALSISKYEALALKTNFIK